MRVSATYEGEEIVVTFGGARTSSWEGHPDMPHKEYWIDDIEVEEVTILGADVSMKDLPEALQAAILALSEDVEFEE